MHLILFGATGLVGTATLATMLSDPSITKISIPSRRPVPQAQGHDKATVIIHKDFSKYDEDLLERFSDAHGCIWALGPPLGSVSRAEYIYAHTELPHIAAKALSQHKKTFNFVFVSQAWIPTSPPKQHPWSSPSIQAKYFAEQNLKDTANRTSQLHHYSVRLAALDYSTHDAIKPFVQSPLPLLKRFANTVMPAIKWWSPDFVCRSQDFGGILVDLAKSDGKDLSVGGDAETDRRVLNHKDFSKYLAGISA